MSEGLPWMKMILLIALLAGMFVIPAAGIKLHGAYQRRRARHETGDSTIQG